MKSQYNLITINVVREILFSAMSHISHSISHKREVIEDALDVYLNRDVTHYHNLYHIYDVVMYIFEQNRGNLDGIENSLIAALFHDIVYIPGRYDNEIKSAEYAKNQLLKISCDFNDIQDIEKLIEATTYPLHDYNNNFNCRHLPLIRADLNGLLSLEKYRESTEKVYWETQAYFPNLDKEEFTRRRAAFFKALFEDKPYNKITEVFNTEEILTIKKNVGIT